MLGFYDQSTIEALHVINQRARAERQAHIDMMRNNSKFLSKKHNLHRNRRGSK